MSKWVLGYYIDKSVISWYHLNKYFKTYNLSVIFQHILSGLDRSQFRTNQDAGVYPSLSNSYCLIIEKNSYTKKYFNSLGYMLGVYLPVHYFYIDK